MQFSIPTALLFTLSTLSALSVASPAPDSHIARLGNYKSTHSGLNSAQLSALSQAEGVAKAGDASKAESVRAAVEDAFGPEEASYILTGKVLLKKDRLARDLQGRAPQCECSDRSEFCGNGFGCQYKSQGCLFQDKGCGTLGLYVCNGLCVKV